jgi:uncharacterized protein DUF899
MLPISPARAPPPVPPQQLPTSSPPTRCDNSRGDFHVTNDEKVAPIEYNYRNKAELEARNGPNAMKGEEHGLSVFFILDDDVFHTYSVYARGTETLTDARNSLTRHPMGATRTLRTHPPVGLRGRPTDSPRDKGLACRRATLAAGAVRDVGRGCVLFGFSSIRMSVCAHRDKSQSREFFVGIALKADIEDKWLFRTWRPLTTYIGRFPFLRRWMSARRTRRRIWRAA